MTTIRPGDWRCGSCHDHVYARHNACRKCGAQKSAGSEFSEDTYGTKGGGAGVFRPGDWTCPKCNDHVFSFNPNCRKCGTLKPGYRAGDWICPNPACRDQVYSRNLSCRKCGAQRPSAGGPIPGYPTDGFGMDQMYGMPHDPLPGYGGYPPISGGYPGEGGYGRPIGYRPGDWTCPNPVCRDHVFASHSACRKCGATKPFGIDEGYGGNKRF